jgi:large subunit ribosomal protein L21
VYAVIESGGKQYIAREGAKIDVDRLKAEVGKEIRLDSVLLTASNGDVNVGTPTVEGAEVVAEVVGHVKGPKILVFKYKPKVRYRRRQGHRQLYTRLQIKSIGLLGGKKGAAGPKKAQEPAKAEAPKKPAKAAKPAAPRLDDIDLDSMLKADLESLADQLGVTPEKGSGAGGNVLVKDLRQAIEKALKK